jgi:signal transduction histidine kinase
MGFMRLGSMPLAHKCLLSFGAAVVLIVFGAMVGPWLRMVALIDAGELELSRELVRVWEREGNAERLRAAEIERQATPSQPTLGDVEALRSAAEGPSGNAPNPSLNPALNPSLDPAQIPPLAVPRPDPVVDPDAPPASRVRAGVGARRLSLAQAEEIAKDDDFVREALASFRADEQLEDFHDGHWSGTTREYRYAKAQRAAGRTGSVLMSVVVLDRRSLPAARMLLINSAHLIGTGVVVLVAAMGVFYFITRALVLRPVKELEDAAERVRQGNFAVRARINTGDEFQHLAETLNLTLSDLQASQDRLRAINAAMDIKLHELSEANSTLFQTAKMKGEFLASVSHELRTPLNSIIGFAELLQETARGEVIEGEPTTPTISRRLRYLDNIITAGKNLLNMINSLLEMARIEAGKVEIRPERVGLRDACEGLLGLIAPLAQKKGITLNLEASEDLPPIRTDAKKLQQIVFNFLSNAVKFTESKERTGREPQITLRAERLVWSSPGSESEERVRISVIDNGPGISAEEKERIFEKFYQVHGGHTREHAGTGLGLAIVRDLANLLGAQIQVESEVGRGSMFSVILPLSIPEGTKEARVVAEAVAAGESEKR